MKAISIGLALIAFVAGLRAAHLWHQASRVLIIPMWENNGRIEPVSPDQSQTGWIVAMIEMNQKAGSLNRRAAKWTAAAVLFGTASTLIATL